MTLPAKEIEQLLLRVKNYATKYRALEYLKAFSQQLSVKKWGTAEEYEKVVKEVFDGQTDIMAEVAQEWIALGLNEGLAKGRAEGLNEGLALGRLEGLNEGLALGRLEGLNEGLAKGLNKGLNKGLAKGRVEGFTIAMVKAVCQTIAIRFEVKRKRYINLLKKLPLAKLEQLNKVALKAQNLAEFEARLKKMLPQETTTQNL